MSSGTRVLCLAASITTAVASMATAQVMPESATVIELSFTGPPAVTIGLSGKGLDDDAERMELPVRQSFRESGIYRIRLDSFKDHVGLELYPTVEVSPLTPRVR